MHDWKPTFWQLYHPETPDATQDKGIFHYCFLRGFLFHDHIAHTRSVLLLSESRYLRLGVRLQRSHIFQHCGDHSNVVFLCPWTCDNQYHVSTRAIDQGNGWWCRLSLREEEKEHFLWRAFGPCDSIFYLYIFSQWTTRKGLLQVEINDVRYIHCDFHPFEYHIHCDNLCPNEHHG